MKHLLMLLMIATLLIAGCDSNPVMTPPLPVDLAKVQLDNLRQANQYIEGTWQSRYHALAEKLVIKSNHSLGGLIQVDSLQFFHYQLDSAYNGAVKLSVWNNETRAFTLFLSHLENGQMFVARGKREFFEHVGKEYTGWWKK